MLAAPKRARFVAACALAVFALTAVVYIHDGETIKQGGPMRVASIPNTPSHLLEAGMKDNITIRIYNASSKNIDDVIMNQTIDIPDIKDPVEEAPIEGDDEDSDDSAPQHGDVRDAEYTPAGHVHSGSARRRTGDGFGTYSPGGGLNVEDEAPAPDEVGDDDTLGAEGTDILGRPTHGCVTMDDGVVVCSHNHTEQEAHSAANASYEINWTNITKPFDEGNDRIMHAADEKTQEIEGASPSPLKDPFEATLYYQWCSPGPHSTECDPHPHPCNETCGFPGQLHEGRVFCEEIVTLKKVDEAKCSFPKPPGLHKNCPATPACVEWHTGTPTCPQRPCDSSPVVVSATSTCHQVIDNLLVSDSMCIDQGKTKPIVTKTCTFPRCQTCAGLGGPLGGAQERCCLSYGYGGNGYIDSGCAHEIFSEHGDQEERRECRNGRYRCRTATSTDKGCYWTGGYCAPNRL